MSTVISTKSSGVGGLTVTGDASGVLELASANGTTAVTIDASQNVTLAKGLTVGASAAPAFSAYLGTNQAISSGADTVILFDNKTFDTNTNYATATGRFTPTVAGYYQVNASLGLSGSGITLASGNFRKNTAIFSFLGTTAFAFNSTPFRLSGSTLIYCNGSTDYIDVTGYVQASSGWQATSSSTFSAFLARSA